MKLHSLFTAMTLASCACVSFAADFEKDVNDLIPGLAAADASGRYEPMMQMQALAANASKPGSEADRLALSRVLAAKAVDASVPQPARVWLIRQLEYIGKGESVEALTKVLSDPDAELRECARRALQKNPDSAAGKPLIAALEAVGPEQTPDAVRWKNGLISALGQRRDRAAVSAIAKRLAEPELETVSALALGSIGNSAAVESLWGAFEKSPVVTDGLLRAAEQQLVAGAKAGAAAICQKIYEQSNAAQQKAAALAILAKAEPLRATGPITEALRSSDWRLQKAAVDAVPDALGTNSRLLVALMDRLPERQKVFVLSVLEASSEPKILRVAKDGTIPVRIAALEALGRIGSGAAVPVLLEAAKDRDTAVKAAAVAALGTVNGPGATAAIEQAAGRGDPIARAVAIAALAARNDTAALPALVKYAADNDVTDSDSTVSKAACAALAKFGSEKELPALVELVLAGNTKGADEALQAVASRATDKSGAAQMVVQRAGSASGPQLAAMLEVLGMLGGEEALGAVVKFTGSDNAATRESAIRALANWQEFPAAKPLLDIAANPQTSDVLCILSLQGMNRLAKAAEKDSGADRVAAVQAAMKAARRDQERKLAVSSLGAIADRKAADALLPLLKDPQWGKDAGTASLNLADALRRTNDRNTSRKLAEAVKAANLSEELNKRADAILTRR